ncbi:uncharacterized protein LOC126551620 [Aphis gossypii]|uniref:C2H2-type domain-containing protein n=1 Tax=Aphis gossypii TaxID=80765 RepID=A0A9P0NNP8_APHGO|nr:uncharacterized protein LOC126551620 [Aphis gossypii]CAH1733199.1 unnamed protein product [Aphis gossypii]
MVYKAKNGIKKNKNKIQHEIPQNRIKKIRGKYNKQNKKSKCQTPVNSNSCVSQKSMTPDNAGTSTDTSNNEDKFLNVLNDNRTISITTNDDINSMDIANNDTLTSAYIDLNGNSGNNNYTVCCEDCMHQEDDIVRKIMECVPKEFYVSATNNGSPYENYLSKDSWKPDENHMKALDESCEIEQPFFCEFCNKICEEYDHYQLNRWCAKDQDLKCYVCKEEYFVKKRLQLHESEHVRLLIC